MSEIRVAIHAATVRPAAILMTCAALMAAQPVLAPAPAQASSISILVNDEPITDYDIQQRTRLIAATSGGRQGRPQAVEELIEERLKLQSARRLNVTVSEQEVEQAFNSIAQRVNMSPSQFVQALSQIGASADSLRTRLRADLAWRDVVRNQLQRDIQIRDRDVETVLATRGEEATSTSYELTVRQVLFVIPAGSSSDYTRQRRQDANTFRSRFSGCDSIMELAREFRDTVVRPEVRRNTAELPPNLAERLVPLSVGQITAPSDTDNAVEMVAVCDRQEVADDRVARREIQSDMMNQQGERLARRLLMDLKQAASIERR